MLATYIGQAKALRDRLRSAGLIHERPADGDEAAAQPSVRVSTVDNFQGEEADVIVLSLVRSNGGGGIGFLSIANRVCVALSRARHGFYILGNATCLRASRSPLWRTILAYLEEQNALGRRLPLLPRDDGARAPDGARAAGAGGSAACGRNISPRRFGGVGATIGAALARSAVERTSMRAWRVIGSVLTPRAKLGPPASTPSSSGPISY